MNREAFALFSLVFAGLISSPAEAQKAQEFEPFLGAVPEYCWAYRSPEGWGVKCPQINNEQSFSARRNRPHATLPGHSADESAFTPSAMDSPEQCLVVLDELVKRAGQFTSWLRGVRFGGKHYGALTGDAAYEVGQMIHTYTIRMEREAKLKYRHSPRGGNGDQLCTDHAKFAVSEIMRVAQLVIDEANRGNRDLAGTGLNPHESKYNQ